MRPCTGHLPTQDERECDPVLEVLWYFEATPAGKSALHVCKVWPTRLVCDRIRHGKDQVGMPAQFIKRLFEKLCPHQLSWPHSGVHGQDYQVCLICGATYEYDWTTMRRTGRLAASDETRKEE